ncbi:DUF6518 family protein [Cellulomonas sp.]|uniref:DUF6518 family protein n=1 Tax=Cellulomonas sp. TaxID=40001 RepID=UPI001B2BFBDD|nr:DUF6518 family protein [Cellulomonas sp.]MBO9554349.1 hypothetical protein [Cellulomonas sp.]
MTETPARTLPAVVDVAAHRPGVDRLLPLLGVAVGVLTSFAQGWLDSPWAALANAASPWLVIAFAVGYRGRTAASAAVLGLVTCLGEVAGYYAAAAARGFGVSTGWVVFWLVCAVVGGPLFGACGRLVRVPRTWLAACAAAAPAATFLGEGIGSYWLRLGYLAEAVLFVVLGLTAGALALVRTPARPTTVAAVAVGTLAASALYGVLLGSLG